MPIQPARSHGIATVQKKPYKFFGQLSSSTEQFKDLNMVEKTQAFYKKYYGYTLSKENAEQILKGLAPLSSIFI